MASILTEDILNKLLCSICKQYLSHDPIKVTKAGETFCGRCSTEQPLGSISLLYGQVARFSLFPCINRFEGCNVLLQYQDVIQHEKNCIGKKFECPICPVEHYRPNSLLYLINHYKTVHTKYVLNENKFEVNSCVISEDAYLFCDSYKNCVFIIKIGCNGRQIFLNAYIIGKKLVKQKFKVNNVLYPNVSGTPCPSLQELGCQHIAVDLKDLPSRQNKLVSCEFVYKIQEQIATVVVMNLNTFNLSSAGLRKMPILYLDTRHFQGNKKHYKLSPCKSLLINDHNETFSVELKCSYCNTYFWNISSWEKMHYPTSFESGSHVLFRSRYNENLVCNLCRLDAYRDEEIFNSHVLEADIYARIFRIRFYCRYECGKMYPVWQLCFHEKECEFNLEKLSDEEFVKKYFGEASYNPEARFINGNIVKPFSVDVMFCPLGSSLVHEDTIITPERVIYVITDDGEKCKVFYKYDKGTLYIYAKNYNDSTRLIRIRSGEHMCDEFYDNFYTEMYLSYDERPDGTMISLDVPYFAVWVERVDPDCNVTI